MSDNIRPTVELLANELKDVTNWYEFGVALGIPLSNLDCIEIENSTVEKQKIKMFQFWLRSNPDASWKLLIQALEGKDYSVLAADLSKKYLVTAYSQAKENSTDEDLSGPETKRLKLGVSTETTDGIQQTIDNHETDHARIELPQVDTSLPGRPKIPKWCKVSASKIHRFEDIKDEELEKLACTDLTDQIHKWEETQRQKRKRKMYSEIGRKLENTPSPLQERSTNLTPVEDQSDTCSILDGALSLTCHVDQEPSSYCPVNADGQTEDLSDKQSQSDTKLRSVPKKSWREKVLEDYRKANPDVSMENEKPSYLLDAKKRITGKPQYEVCADGELGILHILSSSPRNIEQQIQALLYAGEEKGIKFCDYIKKKGKESSVTERIYPDREWQERVVPKVHKYCKYFDQQWKQVQLQYGSK